MVHSLLEMVNNFAPLPHTNQPILQNGMSLLRFYSYIGLMKKSYEASQCWQKKKNLRCIQFA